MVSTIVVHLPPPMQKRAFHLMVARALELADEGNEVEATHCAQTGGTCSANVLGSKLVCLACQYSTKRTIRPTELKLVPLRAASRSSETSSPVSFGELRHIVIGVRSGLVTLLRILPRDFKKVRRLETIKRRYSVTATQVLSAMKKRLDETGADRVEVLNGRFACTKLAIIAASGQGIPFTTLDYNGMGKPLIFHGYTPHDRTELQARILRNVPDQELASEYFGGRKTAKYNKFATQHRQFSPPVIQDTATKKISFFLSSQDECESLGPSWRSPFKDTTAVVRDACLTFPDYFFCVRFHPNQAGIISDTSSTYRELEGLPNLKIFYATDDVNSYSLVDWSDVVVTFASTISIEACWAGKPVIQLGPSFYDQLGVSYNPKSQEEFLEFLASDLSPKPQEPAARFAHFKIEDYDPIKYLDCRSAKGAPLGFRRKASLLAKPAKEINLWAITLLKRVCANRLARVTPKSRKVLKPTHMTGISTAGRTLGSSCQT